MNPAVQDIIGGIMIMVVILSVLFIWAMHIHREQNKPKQQDVHVWDVHDKVTLADVLLTLRDQGYTVTHVIPSIIKNEQHSDPWTLSYVTHAVIITEK